MEVKDWPQTVVYTERPGEYKEGPMSKAQEWSRVIAEHGIVIRKIHEEAINADALGEGRYLMVWSPEECESMLDLQRRLRELEGRGMA